MMSLSRAFGGVGAFLGITIGGILLNAYGYQAVGLFLGASGFASIAIVLFLAKEPSKTQPNKN